MSQAALFQPQPPCAPSAPTHSAPEPCLLTSLCSEVAGLGWPEAARWFGFCALLDDGAQASLNRTPRTGWGGAER